MKTAFQNLTGMMTDHDARPPVRNSYTRREQRSPRGLARFVFPLFLLIFIITLFLLARSMMIHHFLEGARYHIRDHR